MGNGMLAFAMLAVQAVLLRRPVREVTAVVLWGLVAVAAYFVGYEKPFIPHPDMSLLTQAKLFSSFVLVFLGNPLAVFVGPNVEICMVVGAASLLTIIVATLWMYTARQLSAYRAFLIGVYGFVVLSTLAAMTGRGYGGAGAAVASRYTTGPLLAWVVLALLLFDISQRASRRLVLVGVTTVLATIVATWQVHIEDDASYLYNWKLAVLAHKSGLDRPDLDALLFPGDAHEHFVMLADFAAKRSVALYGKGWLRDAGLVKYSASARDDSWCRGWFDFISHDGVGPVAQGWVVAKGGQRDLLIVLATQAGTTVGYGLSGKDRPDVVAAFGTSAKHAGWTAFSSPTAEKVIAYVYRGEKFCYLGEAKSVAP